MIFHRVNRNLTEFNTTSYPCAIYISDIMIYKNIFISFVLIFILAHFFMPSLKMCFALNGQCRCFSWSRDFILSSSGASQVHFYTRFSPVAKLIQAVLCLPHATCSCCRINFLPHLSYKCGCLWGNTARWICRMKDAEDKLSRKICFWQESWAGRCRKEVNSLRKSVLQNKMRESSQT